MRILHTSDWHIGRSFHGYSTLEALGEVLTALVDQVRELRVDVVVVAGDVFDTATPAAAAFGVLDETLLAIHEAGARVVMTSGNHDSAARLGFHARLLRDGIHVLTDPADVGRPVTIDDEHGPVHFFGIPYLEPAIVRARWPEAGLRTQAQTMAHAMDLVRDGMATNPGRSVAAAHCFAAGVQATDGLEREVRQGGLDVVPLSAFDGPDYVALGHIHGRQQLSERVRYSGAPLHYSFSEEHKERGSWLVELGPNGFVSAEWIALPIPRRVVTLRGTLEEILAAPDIHAEDWVRAVYTDPVPQHEPMRRIRERFPYCAQVVHEPAGGASTTQTSYAARLRESVSDSERIDAFLAHVRAGEGASEHEATLISEILDERTRAEANV